jgi:hypothetical protein
MAGLSLVQAEKHLNEWLSADSAVAKAQAYLFGGRTFEGAGSASLGSNCPALAVSAPFTWIQVKTADGSTAHIPVCNSSADSL